MRAVKYQRKAGIRSDAGMRRCIVCRRQSLADPAALCHLPVERVVAQGFRGFDALLGDLVVLLSFVIFTFAQLLPPGPRGSVRAA